MLASRFWVGSSSVSCCLSTETGKLGESTYISSCCSLRANVKSSASWVHDTTGKLLVQLLAPVEAVVCVDVAVEWQ